MMAKIQKRFMKPRQLYALLENAQMLNEVLSSDQTHVEFRLKRDKESIYIALSHAEIQCLAAISTRRNE